MDVSIFLAKVIGIYFLVIGLGLLFKTIDYKALVNDLLKPGGLSFLAAFITLILGLLLVLSHNVWYGGYPVLITILAWITLLKGLVWMLFPDFFRGLSKNFMTPAFTQFAGIVGLVLGLYLGYMGFFA